MVALEQDQTEERRADLRPASGTSLLGALVIVAKRHNLALSIPQLIRDHHLEPGQPTPAQLLQIANAAGLQARSTRLTGSEFFALRKGFPAIVLLRNGAAMVVQDVVNRPNDLNQVILQDPNARDDARLVLDETRFLAAWTGDLLLFKRHYALTDEEQPFGLRLIIGMLVHDRRLARNVGLCAFFLGLLSLSPIIFLRLLLDRVMYYQSLGTLSVLCAAMLAFIAFETAFGYLRRHFVQYVSRAIDVKLSTYIFDRVIRLPIDFFERTFIGEVIQPFGEFQKVRTFLSGPFFGLVLDVFMLLVFLPIMFCFSPLLTSIFLALAAVISGWLVFRLPEIRRTTGEFIRAEIAKGNFLIETLHGVRAVKALGLDARRRHRWDGLVATSVQRGFDQGRTANQVLTVVHPFERMMTSGVFAVAVFLAITTNHQIYVGALIAFMMLAQRVVQPLMQAAQLITQYDEVRIAIKIIASLVNRQPEEGHGKDAVRASVTGRVEFSKVRFRYVGSNTPAVDDVSFTIPAGSVFGIMGRSGSGKSTVVRLLQLFHGNYEGQILVDGVELRQYEIHHLRSAFGVVMQENFLFSGTIRETIASGKPNASFDEVVMAARLAGAEEFIQRLQRGYDTYVYEGSPNLSGGQRQRLAIARALITDPRILILDEATSALDAESEAIVNANLMRIAEGRTVIIISHRLSSLIAADAILVLERGRLYDIGTHSELVERCDIYSNLWHQQNQHALPRPMHEVVTLHPAQAT